MQLASLLCKAGNNCGPCKHKAAISQIYNISEFCVLPESDQNIRGLDHYIADGVVCANSWYRDLNKPEHETDVNNFVETSTNKIGDLGMNIEVINTIENASEAEAEVGHYSNHEYSSDEDENNDILDNFEIAMDLLKQKGWCNNCPRANCPRRQLSKKTIVQGTVVQVDSCPRRLLSKGQFSKETFVQGRHIHVFCPRNYLKFNYARLG